MKYEITNNLLLEKKLNLHLKFKLIQICKNVKFSYNNIMVMNDYYFVGEKFFFKTLHYNIKL